MDEGCSKAVQEVFVRLYDKGLIYRGNRMINWCPHCNTSISDAEVEYEAQDGQLLAPAATRSKDDRRICWSWPPPARKPCWAIPPWPSTPRTSATPHLHRQQRASCPCWTGRSRSSADEYADMEFGTGVVKITPAHDPNDFEVGKRHDLP